MWRKNELVGNISDFFPGRHLAPPKVLASGSKPRDYHQPKVIPRVKQIFRPMEFTQSIGRKI